MSASNARYGCVNKARKSVMQTMPSPTARYLVATTVVVHGCRINSARYATLTASQPASVVAWLSRDDARKKHEREAARAWRDMNRHFSRHLACIDDDSRQNRPAPATTHVTTTWTTMEAVAHQLKNGPAALFKACWMPKTDDEPAERWSLSTTGD